jgi:SAM-dependent methyltransferase
MAEPIRFQNGAEYDAFMGNWSRLAGDRFLDWLSPERGAKWADVGCGNGAFTELIARRFAPGSIDGIDPSYEQIEFARSSPAAKIARFQQGNSMALPFADDSMDIAVMALVLFFVPEPQKGADEMVRVVRSKGLVAAYTWDILEGGFPYDAVFAGLAAQGFEPTLPPSAAVSRLSATLEVWNKAGLEAVDSTVIEVSRHFDSFEEYWRLAQFGPGLGNKLAEMRPDQSEALMNDIKHRLSSDSGPFDVSARAIAIKGIVP